MAQLDIKQESPSLLVLGKPFGARLVNLLIGFALLGAILYVLFGWLRDSESGGEGPGLFLLILGYLVWTNLSSGLTGLTVTFDSSTRSVSVMRDLLGFPLNRAELPFDRIRRVLVRARVPVLSAQTGMRAVWQVFIEPTDGDALTVNANGLHSQMLDLGNKIARQTGLPLVDELAQVLSGEQPSAPQPIQDYGGGGPPTYAPPVAAPVPLGRRTRVSQSSDRPAPTPAPKMDQAERDLSPEAARPSPPVVERIKPDATGVAPPSEMTMPFDTGQPAMPSMPSIGLSDIGSSSGMPSMPPLGTGPGQGQTFSMPPLGGMGTGSGMDGVSYSPPPLAMPDQLPLGSPGGGPITAPASPTPAAEDIPGTRRASWVRPRTEEELGKAIGEDPTDSRSFYEMARLWHARGDYNRALAAYLQAVHLDPASAPAQNDLGVLYLQRGKYQEAETAFRRASGLDPFFVIGHYNLGLLLARTRRSSEARQTLTRGQQSAANDAERQLFDNALQGRFVPPLLSPV